MKVAAQKQAAEILATLFGQGYLIEALPEECRPTTVAEAYRIQDRVVSGLGFPLAGWKVGATGAIAQKLLGAKGPFAGRVFAGRLFQGDVTLPASAYRLRGLEAEFAFRLKTALPARAEAYGREEVLAAVDTVLPAVEVVDSRFSGGLKSGIANVIADLGVHGCFVLGDPIPRWATVDLIAAGASMTINGTTVAQGTGAAVLGDPVASLVWLANHARRHGGVAAGMIVPTGSMTGVSFAPASAVAVADYGPFGKITVTFVE